MITVRIDSATRRIKPGYVSASGPFFAPPGAGEADVTLATDQPPATADGRRAWGLCRLTEDLATVEVDDTLVPPLGPAVEFDAQRWIKATNLYWLDVVTQLVAGLNQVRVNPAQAFAAATAPTVAEVKAGVVAKYQALG